MRSGQDQMISNDTWLSEGKRCLFADGKGSAVAERKEPVQDSEGQLAHGQLGLLLLSAAVQGGLDGEDKWGELQCPSGYKDG